jgi:glycosyltransferase involved in cell wall biosynthesis
MPAESARRIHVVEPTLEDYAGHCYDLVRSLCDGAAGRAVTVWSGKRAARLDFDPRVSLQPCFSRRWRIPQLFWLFRRLLAGDEPVVLTTARRVDLTLAGLAARGPLPPGRLYLYFHWYRESPRRVSFLRKMAATQPGITILATTERVADTFRRAGFRRVVWLPYPLTARPPANIPAAQGFRHLLYAGAARQEKGFGRIVDLVERLHAERENLPVTVQASAEHYGKYEDRTRADIRCLERTGYGALTVLRETLRPADYADMFRGAICIQPYDPGEFRDRVSGVTLDALAYGSPVIVPANTWMARVIEPHDAGMAVPALDAGSMLAAARRILTDYDRYHRNALAGGIEQRKRSWKPLLELIDRST